MRRLTITLFSIALLSLSVHGNTQQTSTIQIYLFYAVDCPGCQGILESYVPALKSNYPFLDIKTFDIANTSYYEALARLEEKFNRRGNELPVIFIGDHLLSGQKEITESLDPLLLEYQMKGGITSLPPLEIPPTATPPEKAFSLDLAYFYQKGCQKCDRASYLLKYLAKKYPGLNIREIDLDTSDGKRLNETFSNRLNLPQEKRLIAPSLFIGKDCLSSGEITESRVEALIQKYEKIGTQSVLEVEKGEIKKGRRVDGRSL